MGSRRNDSELQLVPRTIFLLILSSSRNLSSSAQIFPSAASYPGTNLLRINNVSQAQAQAPAQVDDTIRVNPADSFKKYRGGFNVTNKHYWSSTIFTGVYGYIIGALWLFCGTVYGTILLATPFCIRSRKNGNFKLKKKSPHCYKRSCYLWRILLATLFTLLAIIACGLVIGGNAGFDLQARRVVNIVIDTADNATSTMYKTTGAMKDMRGNLGAVNDSRSTKTSGFLTTTSEQLDVEAHDIQRQARKNRRLIDKGLNFVYVITTVTISVNLVAVVALSVCGILRLRPALDLLIVFCWILSVVCWFFFGLYFFLGEFSNDACTALENFQKNPYNNSLSSILPCHELLSAKPALYDVSQGIYNIVDQVNANLSTMQGAPRVCNPFSSPPDYQFQGSDCPDNTIPIADIPQVLKMITCFDNGTCSTGQFITASQSQAAEAYSTSIQSLLNVYPEMESLVECQSVKDAFSLILEQHCKPLKGCIHMVWSSMVFLSLTMVFLILIWTIQDRHDQQNHCLNASIRPHSLEDIPQ